MRKGGEAAHYWKPLDDIIGYRFDLYFGPGNKIGMVIHLHDEYPMLSILVCYQMYIGIFSNVISFSYN